MSKCLSVVGFSSSARHGSAAIISPQNDVKLVAAYRTLTDNDTIDSRRKFIRNTPRIVSHTAQKVFGLVVGEITLYSIFSISVVFFSSNGALKNYVHLIHYVQQQINLIVN